MVTKYLGKTVDIHGGGLDICFPHHKCEIAQVKPVRGHDPYVRCGMHTTMVGCQGVKMSKSLGNLVMVDKLLDTYLPVALRLYLGSHRYRATWSFNETELMKFQELANLLRQAVRVESGKNASFSPTKFVCEFSASMENDLGTSRAVEALKELPRGILEAAKGRREVKEAQEMLLIYSMVFVPTLASDTPKERMIKGWNAKKRSTTGD